MSSIDTVNVKLSYNADGGLFSISVDMQVKNDGWPLASEQMKAANDLAEQAKTFEEEKIKAWLSESRAKTYHEQLGSPQPQKLEAPIPSTDTDKPAYDPQKKQWNYCDKHPQEQIWHESKNKPGVLYQYCPSCEEFLQKDGTRMKRGKK